MPTRGINSYLISSALYIADNDLSITRKGWFVKKAKRGESDEKIFLEVSKNDVKMHCCVYEGREIHRERKVKPFNIR